MKITFIGTSSGLSVLDRSHAALLCDFDDYKILLDCGEGATRSLLKQKIDPCDIDRIIISHTHPDHCSGIPILMQYMHLKKRVSPLFIFLPLGVANAFLKFFHQLFLLNGKISFNYDIEEYDSGVILRHRNLCISAIPNRHLIGYESYIRTHLISLSSFSLVIQQSKKKIYYSADLLDENDLKPPAKSDLMIVESTHIPLPLIIAKAKTLKIPRIILTHIAPDVSTDIHLSDKVISVEYAFDGMTFVL